MRQRAMRQRASRRMPALSASGGASLLGGVGLGLTAMYFLDAAHGRRRRARIGEGVRHAAQATGAGLARSARTAARRTGTLAGGVGARLHRAPVPDEVVLARAHAAVHRLLLHPGLVTARVVDGRVTLEGTVLAGERGRLVKTVRHAHGVRRVVDRLVVHTGLESMSPAPRSRHRWRLRAATFAAGAVAGALIAQRALH